MDFRKEPLEYYIERFKNNDYFSLGLYGDGELTGIYGSWQGATTAIGEHYSQGLCDELKESLKIVDENFLIATDINLALRIDTIKDLFDGVVFDEKVRLGLLAPFIKQLRQMNVVIVGNRHLRNLHFLLYDKFIEIPETDCYLEIDRTEQEILDYGKPGIFLFSMGLAAIPLISRLHGKIRDSFLLDMGSIWDVFCGIGLQRGWRQELEMNPEEKHRILSANLRGV